MAQINPHAISIERAGTELDALDGLLGKGHITQEQYNARKWQILYDAGFAVSPWKSGDALAVSREVLPFEMKEIWAQEKK